MDFRFWASRAVVAFLGFVVMDLTAKVLCPSALLEKYEPREKTLLADLVRAWNEAPQAPEICFMGSSLMQCALKNSSPTFLNEAGSFSWALGGENASDSYIIAQRMMSKEKKPKLLIYGIAPRDLLDNNVKSPVSTDIFRYLSSLESVINLPADAFISVDDRVNCLLKQTSFLVDRKNVFSKAASDGAAVLISNMVPAGAVKKSAQALEQDQIAQAQAQLTAPDKPGDKPKKVAEFTQEQLAAVKPGDPMAKKIAAFELLQQVSKGVTIFRYNPYCAERYNRQIVFLDMLLSHLENIGVQVVVVEMPLKREHVAIMPKELLSSYSKDVARLATKYGASLLDFNSPEFKDSDYGDVAHLNSAGAKIWQAKLVETFKSSPYRERLAIAHQSQSR